MMNKSDLVVGEKYMLDKFEEPVTLALLDETDTCCIRNKYGLTLVDISRLSCVAKEKRKLVKYINIYPSGISGAFQTRENADTGDWGSDEAREACVRMETEYEVGQFDV